MIVVAAAWSCALAQIPGVESLQAGMRVTFYSSSASVRGTTQQAVFKPNCNPAIENCWVNSSGQTIGLQDVPTASGQGYTQLDLLYLDDQSCVFRVTSYMVDPSSGAVITGTGGGVSSPGGSCLDYWIAPAELRQLQVQDSGGFRVLRGPYTIGGLTFESVSIGNFGAGASNHSSYDSVTGLLVVASSRTQGASVPTIVGSTVTPGAGNTQLTYSLLVNVRALQASALLERLPTHVVNASRLFYSCSQGTGMPGYGSIEIPCRYDVTIGQRNELWAHATARLEVPDGITSIPTVVEGEHIIAATGQGSFLAAPGWLATLQPGTELDHDPVTGITAFVDRVDDSVVVIVERSNAELKRFVYDRRLGWLRQLYIEQFNQLGSFTQFFELTGVQ